MSGRVCVLCYLPAACWPSVSFTVRYVRYGVGQSVRAVAERIESVLICLLFRYAPAYSPRLQPVGSRDAPCPTRPLTYEHAYEAGEVEMEIRVVGCLLFSLKTARYGSSASFRTAPPCGGPALTSMLLEVEERNWCCALAGLWSCEIAGLTLVEAAP